MNAFEPYRFKNRVAANFGAKVAQYAGNAVIQQKLLEKVVSLIQRRSAATAARWVDLGCGNGALERMLQAGGFAGSLIGLDIAPDSLHFCRRQSSSAIRWMLADIDYLPFKPRSFDGIVAASVVQWSLHLEETLQRIMDLLNDNGTFVFSMFIEGSFRELVDMRSKHGLPPAVSLPEPDDIIRLLKADGCPHIVFDRFTETVFFPSSRALLRHLSAIGSTCAPSHMSRSALERFCTDFDEHYGTGQGVPLTYAAILGTAEKGDAHG